MGKALQDVISEFLTKLNNREIGNFMSLFLHFDLEAQSWSVYEIPILWCYKQIIGQNYSGVSLINVPLIVLVFPLIDKWIIVLFKSSDQPYFVLICLQTNDSWVSLQTILIGGIFLAFE